MERLKVEYVPIDSLQTYAGNAKIHTAEQVEQIKASINEFGFNDPIAVWRNEIVEGHGRYMACQELGIKEVPIIRLDSLTDEQRRAYTLVHNQLTLNTGFDIDMLQMELENIGDIDMGVYGLDDISLADFDEETAALNDLQKYTNAVKIPQYEPTGADVDLDDLVNLDKFYDLTDEIEVANIPVPVKEFLRIAAYRHAVFNYRNIAEYYAKAPAEVQRLMERSALVIIDVDDAIANGFVKLSKTIADLLDEVDDNA